MKLITERTTFLIKKNSYSPTYLPEPFKSPFKHHSWKVNGVLLEQWWVRLVMSVMFAFTRPFGEISVKGSFCNITYTFF